MMLVGLKKENDKNVRCNIKECQTNESQTTWNLLYFFLLCRISPLSLFIFFLGDDTQVSLINGNLEGSFSEKSTSAAGLESE